LFHLNQKQSRDENVNVGNKNVALNPLFLAVAVSKLNLHISYVPTSIKPSMNGTDERRVMNTSI